MVYVHTVKRKKRCPVFHHPAKRTPAVTPGHSGVAEKSNANRRERFIHAGDYSGPRFMSASSWLWKRKNAVRYCRPLQIYWSVCLTADRAKSVWPIEWLDAANIVYK